MVGCICIIMIIAGILIVDYSVNDLLGKEEKLEVVNLKEINSNYIVINIMNKSIPINTKYVRDDVEGIKKLIYNVLNKR